MSSKPDPLPAENKKTEAVVYISNVSEDVWPFIQAISDDGQRSFEIAENANLADMHLLANADQSDLIFISPRPLQSDFVEYYKKTFSVRKLEVLSPVHHSGEVCRDIMADKQLMNHLVERASYVKKLTLISYSTSWQFLELVAQLRQLGITVYTPESPEEEDAWAVNFFGSKSGIRQLAQKGLVEESDLLIADGLICVSIVDAAKIAAKKYVKEHGVVLKTNKGHSGAGVLIFREGELPDEYSACEREIYRILKQDAYWDQFPIIIEDLINVNYAVGGGFPNVEFKIAKSGRIEFLYYCGLRVSKDGVFGGVEINDDVMNDRLMARIMDLGFFVGEQYAANGYRGYYDVDLVAAKNGKLYISESNARRTGGTHVYQAAMKLIGKEFLTQSYILSSNNWPLPTVSCELSFTQVLKKTSSVLFDKKTQSGVVLASANLLKQQQLAYMVFAPNEKQALEIEAELQRLLS